MAGAGAGNRTLVLRNRQSFRRLDLRHLRRIASALLRDELNRGGYDLGFYLVGESEMTKLNETFLRHRGCTDVITFDYSDPAQPGSLTGEIFICVPEAVVQSRRFRTTWQREVVRYLVHGALHLIGYDDRSAGARRRMKAMEDRLLRRLAARFDLNLLAGGAGVSTAPFSAAPSSIPAEK
jgi:probable rRNA maturation factor